MILKFRESTISRLERLRKREKEGSEGQEDEKDREIVSTKAFLFLCYSPSLHECQSCERWSWVVGCSRFIGKFG